MLQVRQGVPHTAVLQILFRRVHYHRVVRFFVAGLPRNFVDEAVRVPEDDQLLFDVPRQRGVALADLVDGQLLGRVRTDVSKVVELDGRQVGVGVVQRTVGLDEKVEAFRERVVVGILEGAVEAVHRVLHGAGVLLAPVVTSQNERGTKTK